jgi:hypothetical protein
MLRSTVHVQGAWAYRVCVSGTTVCDLCTRPVTWDVCSFQVAVEE